MDYQSIFENMAKWFFTILNGVGRLITFLFTPISQTVTGLTLPEWVTNALLWLQGIFGVDVVPITLLGVTGLTIALIIGIVKAFI